MADLQHAQSFRDLVGYQRARQTSRLAFDLSKRFPREEAKSLTDQMRRAARSIGAQIAEAWGKRQYERHFVSKLADADAEQLETQHWVEVACDSEYITTEQRRQLLGLLAEVGRMLNSMIAKADQFCGPMDRAATPFPVTDSVD
jgi:four helix bundle protein